MVGVKRALSSGSATSSAAEELSRGKRLLAEMEQQQQDGQAVEAEMRDKEIVLGNDGGHPYGIQPWGNSYSPSAEPSIRDTSLGGLRAIGDELLMDVLGMVGAHELCCLARTSRFLYVLAHMDELWRALVISSVGGKFRFKGSWRETYKACVGEGKGELPVHRPIKIKGVYSDSLFQPWLCASLSIPEIWTSHDNIERRSNLSLSQFVEEYENRNRPVIITDVVKRWPAYQKWNRQYLLDCLGDVSLAAGPVNMTISDFLTYSDSCKEERPLYLFDKKFAHHCPQLALDYEVPDYFAAERDMFSLLGPDGRPDYRWVIIGPAGSGSSFHVDPNSTSAWNAVISGRKKWVMFPPRCPPPGVMPSEDLSEVTHTTMSLAEWFMNHYPEVRASLVGGEGGVRPVECVCEAGEMVFVPRGWWHCVLNLEESVAITQNYCGESGILTALDYMKERPQCISGTDRPEDMAERLEAAVMRERPGLLEGFREARRARKEGCKSIWESVVGSSACGDEMGDSKGVPLGGESSDAFSFGFSGNSTSEPAAAKNGGADDGASGGPAAAFSFGF